MLSSRIQAGNGGFTHGLGPTLTSRTTATATANPSIPVHRGTTAVRSVMVAVLIVNTAAIASRTHAQIAYTCTSSPVTWRPTAGVSGPGAAADCNAMSGISSPTKAAAVNSMATNSRPLPKNTDAKNRSARCRSGGGIRPVPAGSPALRGETRRGRRGCVLARGPAGPARGHQPPWGGSGPGRAATAGPGGRRRLRARIPAPGRPGRAGRTCRPRWRSCRRRARCGFRQIHRQFTPSWVTRQEPTESDNETMDKTALFCGLPGRGLT